jgi:hypothetical protein
MKYITVIVILLIVIALGNCKKETTIGKPLEKADTSFFKIVYDTSYTDTVIVIR